MKNFDTEVTVEDGILKPWQVLFQLLFYGIDIIYNWQGLSLCGINTTVDIAHLIVVLDSILSESLECLVEGVEAWIDGPDDAALRGVAAKNSREERRDSWSRQWFIYGAWICKNQIGSCEIIVWKLFGIVFWSLKYSQSIVHRLVWTIAC